MLSHLSITDQITNWGTDCMRKIFKQGGAWEFPWLWESERKCYMFPWCFPLCLSSNWCYGCFMNRQAVTTHIQHWAPVCRKHQERINSCSKWGDFYCSLRQRTLYREMANCVVLWWEWGVFNKCIHVTCSCKSQDFYAMKNGSPTHSLAVMLCSHSAAVWTAHVQ